jgi:hypothetical protein
MTNQHTVNGHCNSPALCCILQVDAASLLDISHTIVKANPGLDLDVFVHFVEEMLGEDIKASMLAPTIDLGEFYSCAVKHYHHARTQGLVVSRSKECSPKPPRDHSITSNSLNSSNNRQTRKADVSTSLNSAIFSSNFTNGIVNFPPDRPRNQRSPTR